MRRVAFLPHVSLYAPERYGLIKLETLPFDLDGEASSVDIRSHVADLSATRLLNEAELSLTSSLSTARQPVRGLRSELGSMQRA